MHYRICHLAFRDCCGNRNDCSFSRLKFRTDTQCRLASMGRTLRQASVPTDDCWPHGDIESQLDVTTAQRAIFKPQDSCFQLKRRRPCSTLPMRTQLIGHLWRSGSSNPIGMAEPLAGNRMAIQTMNLTFSVCECSGLPPWTWTHRTRHTYAKCAISSTRSRGCGEHLALSP